jgi:hypothetical protein
MLLSKIILNTWVMCNQFNFREFCRYLLIFPFS